MADRNGTASPDQQRNEPAAGHAGAKYKHLAIRRPTITSDNYVSSTFPEKRSSVGLRG
jgi:protein tyrosine phosphatase (PTP) superfamily phosphohydrolase (DUF442 family)